MAAFPPNMPAQGDPNQVGSQPPGAPAQGPPNDSSPLSQLGQKGGPSSSSSGSLLQMILMLLAGMGLSHGMDSLPKMLSTLKGGKGVGGKGQIPPQAAAQMAAQQQQQKPDPAMLLKLLAMRGQGSGGSQ